MSFFYLIFILLTAYFSFRYDRIEEYDSHKQHRLWLMCGFLILLTGFSYKLGADKFVYLSEFETYPKSWGEAEDFIIFNILIKGQMPLWTLVNLLCKIIFDSFYAVQLLESAAINISICYLTSKYTHRYFLFLLIYFISLQYFIFNTEVMREGFALSLTLIGIDCYLNGRKWLFFVLLPFAVMFHLSALISLLILVPKINVSWKTLGQVFFVALMMWFLGNIVLGKIMGAALGGVSTFSTKTVYYFQQATTIFGFLRFTIKYLILPFVIMYSVMLQENDNRKKYIKEKIIIFMLILGLISCAIPGLIRIYNYIYVFYLIALADFTFSIFSYKKLFIVRFGTIILSFLLILELYLGHYESTNTYHYEFFYPYTCILDENVDVDFRNIAHDEALNYKADDKNTHQME